MITVGESLSRIEVVQALRVGKTLSNYNWNESEYITYKKGEGIRDENGQPIGDLIFLIQVLTDHDADFFEVKP